jgi:hypothetical protein
MVLLIVATGAITFHRWDWFHSPGRTGYLLMLTAGLILAVLVEWVAVYRLERWKYTEIMPILPGLDIGLVPIAQMLVVPAVIFRTVAPLASEKK